MAHYLIQLNYNASIEVSVEANDEGDAFAKAREVAEQSDMERFSLGGEREPRVIEIR